jgi:hypothetical protein
MEMYRKNDIYTRKRLEIRGLRHLKTILRKQLIVRRIGAAP